MADTGGWRRAGGGDGAEGCGARPLVRGFGGGGEGEAQTREGGGALGASEAEVRQAAAAAAAARKLRRAARARSARCAFGGRMATVVKSWSNYGQIKVKLRSNYGQIMVKSWRYTTTPSKRLLEPGRLRKGGQQGEVIRQGERDDFAILKHS